MDPMEALKMFRLAYESLDRISVSGDRADAAETAANIANDLFNWLSNGGYSPDWALYGQLSAGGR
jgi:hypothetical protein